MAMMRPSMGPTKPKNQKRLGELLLEEGVINEAQLQEALAIQEKEGGFIGQILVQMGHVSSETITRFVVKQYNIPHLSLLDYEINEQVLQYISEETCLRLRLIPIDKLGRILTVAMVDPLDNVAMEEIQQACPDLRIKPIMCDWNHFQTVTERVFSHSAKKNSPYETMGRSGAMMSRETAPPAPTEAAKEGTPPTSVTTTAINAAALAVEPPPAVTLESPSLGVEAARELAEALSERFREAVRDLATALTPAPAAPPANFDPREMNSLMDGMREALRESMSSAAVEIRQAITSVQEAHPVIAPAEGAAPAVVSGPSAKDIKNAVAEAMQEALQPLATAITGLGHLSETPVTAPQAPPDPELLARHVEEGISRAMAPLGERLQSFTEAQQTTPALDPGEWADMTRQAIGAALKDSLEPLGADIRNALMAMQETPEQEAPDWTQMASSIQDSVAGAVEEAMAVMTVQLKTVLNQKDQRDVADQQQGAEILATRLGEAITEAMSGLQMTQAQRQEEMARITQTVLEAIAADHRESREAQQAEIARIAETTLQSIANTKTTQEMQQQQLAQIAEAAMQSVRQTTELIEGHLVVENNRRDLAKGRRARHASVSPFRRALGGEDTPVDSPDLYVEADNRILDALDSEHPIEALTFENFFCGSANAFTFKVSQAVAAAPGGEYNPFFLYGHVGAGKTHLISAVGNAILGGGGNKKNKGPVPRVGYVSASHFARRLSDAATEGALDAFRENYSHWDVLILDDIQFLGGRVEAQEEFFHIFNVLHQQGRQIIIAGDKAPDRLGLLEQRLVSRFASGIVAELKAPEWETRMQILRHKAEEYGVSVPEEILSLIAMRVPGDVRKMTGALRKVAAFAKLVGKDLTVEMAQEILSHLGAEEAA